jgi:hypothetical protein
LTTLLAQVNSAGVEAPRTYDTWNPTFNQTLFDAEEEN